MRGDSDDEGEWQARWVRFPSAAVEDVYCSRHARQALRPWPALRHAAVQCLAFVALALVGHFAPSRGGECEGDIFAVAALACAAAVVVLCAGGHALAALWPTRYPRASLWAHEALALLAGVAGAASTAGGFLHCRHLRQHSMQKCSLSLPQSSGGAGETQDYDVSLLLGAFVCLVGSDAYGLLGCVAWPRAFVGVAVSSLLQLVALLVTSTFNYIDGMGLMAWYGVLMFGLVFVCRVAFMWLVDAERRKGFWAALRLERSRRQVIVERQRTQALVDALFPSDVAKQLICEEMEDMRAHAVLNSSGEPLADVPHEQKMIAERFECVAVAVVYVGVSRREQQGLDLALLTRVLTAVENSGAAHEARRVSSDGVIGLDNPRYDAWGYTVTVAQRLAECAAAQQVLATRDVVRASRSTFDFELLKHNTDVAGIGAIMLFQLHSPHETHRAPDALKRIPISDIATAELLHSERAPAIFECKEEAEYLKFCVMNYSTHTRWMLFYAVCMWTVVLLYEIVVMVIPVHSVFIAALGWVTFASSFLSKLSNAAYCTVFLGLCVVLNIVLCAMSLSMELSDPIGPVIMSWQFGMDTLVGSAAIGIMWGMVMQHTEQQVRQFFRSQKMTLRSQAESDLEKHMGITLLSSVIPPTVLHKVMDSPTPGNCYTQPVLACTALVPHNGSRRITLTSLLQACEVVDMETIVHRADPLEVVQLLNRLYAVFNGSAKPLGFFPLKAAGHKCVFVSSLHLRQSSHSAPQHQQTREGQDGQEAEAALEAGEDHGQRAVLLAKAILQQSAGIAATEHEGGHLRLRCVGVLLTRGCVFDCWGDTVPTAKYLCGAAPPGSALVSEAVAFDQCAGSPSREVVFQGRVLRPRLVQGDDFGWTSLSYTGPVLQLSSGIDYGQVAPAGAEAGVPQYSLASAGAEASSWVYSTGTTASVAAVPPDYSVGTTLCYSIDQSPDRGEDNSDEGEWQARWVRFPSAAVEDVYCSRHARQALRPWPALRHAAVQCLAFVALALVGHFAPSRGGECEGDIFAVAALACAAAVVVLCAGGHALAALWPTRYPRASLWAHEALALLAGVAGAASTAGGFLHCRHLRQGLHCPQLPSGSSTPGSSPAEQSESYDVSMLLGSFIVLAGGDAYGLLGCVAWPRAFVGVAVSSLLQLVALLVVSAFKAYDGAGLVAWYHPFAFVTAFVCRVAFMWLVDAERRKGFWAALRLERSRRQVIVERKRTQELVDALFPSEVAKQLIYEKVQNMRARAVVDSIGEPLAEVPVPEDQPMIAERFECVAVAVVYVGVPRREQQGLDLALLARVLTAVENSGAAHEARRVSSDGPFFCFLCGPQDRSTECARNACSFAQEVYGVMAALSEARVSIGVAMGPVIAGVIGTENPRYDVWGYTVTVAQRLAETATASQILLTRDIAHTLDKCSHYQFAFCDSCVPGIEEKLSELVPLCCTDALASKATESAPLMDCCRDSRAITLSEIAQAELPPAGDMPLVWRPRQEIAYVSFCAQSYAAHTRWAVLMCAVAWTLTMVYTALAGPLPVCMIYVAAIAWASVASGFLARNTPRLYFSSFLFLLLMTHFVLCGANAATDLRDPFCVVLLSWQCTLLVSKFPAYLMAPLALCLALSQLRLYLDHVFRLDTLTGFLALGAMWGMSAWDTERQTRHYWHSHTLAVKSTAESITERHTGLLLLASFIPIPVLRDVMRSQTPSNYYTQSVPSCTALACEVVDMETIVHRADPLEVVQLLNRLYAVFNGSAKPLGFFPLKAAGHKCVFCVGVLLTRGCVFDCWGDTVPTAKYLCGAAPPGCALVSETVAFDQCDCIPFREVVFQGRALGTSLVQCCDEGGLVCTQLLEMSEWECAQQDTAPQYSASSPASGAHPVYSTGTATPAGEGDYRVSTVFCDSACS
eukprot:m51a1_g7093 hypothetical protein (1903) ;mRNA; f:29776-37441